MLKHRLIWKQWCKYMIYIKKGKEPRSLTEYRSQIGATYEDFQNKDDIRDFLLREQGHICAYCMRRIYKDSMKIEHWHAQHAEDGTGEETALDYGNMLGVCDGYKSSPYKDQTCDTHRGNTTIKVDPLSLESIAQIAYRGDGTIYSVNAEIDKDLNETLNLNCEHAHLKENRAAAIRAVQRYCSKKNKYGTWEVAELRKAKRHFETEEEGKKKPYLGAILFFIDRYLKKAGG